MKRALLAVITGVLLFAAPAAHAATDVVVQGTSDITDSDLFTKVIQPGFAKAYPQYNLKYNAVGTGIAIANAEAGAGDALIVHAPASEKPFVDQGYSLEPVGRTVFYSDYVIVGPKDDPAKVATDAPHDVAKAFEDIYKAQAKFVSRNEASGTNVAEQQYWNLTTGLSLFTVKAGQKKPSTTGNTDSPPSWYIQSQQTQGPSLQTANAQSAYTLVDRGTFNKQVNDGSITNLKILADKNDASARGGANLLLNPFTAYAVNPAKVPAGKTVNTDGAKAFLDYMTSADFQAALSSFPSAAQPAFFESAHPLFTPSAALPAVVPAGTTLTFGGTVTNRTPGSASLGGLPITLQATPGVSALGFSAATPVTAATTTSGDDGKYSVSFTPTRTATYRFSSDSVQVAAPGGVALKDLLSPTTVDQGTVHVQAVIGITGAATKYRGLTVTGSAAPLTDRTAAIVTLLGRKDGVGDFKTLGSAAVAPGASYSVPGDSTLLTPGNWQIETVYADPTAVDAGVSAPTNVTIPGTSTVKIKSLKGSKGSIKLTGTVSPVPTSTATLRVRARKNSTGAYHAVGALVLKKGKATSSSLTVPLKKGKWQIQLEYRQNGVTDSSLSVARTVTVK